MEFFVWTPRLQTSQITFTVLHAANKEDYFGLLFNGTNKKHLFTLSRKALVTSEWHPDL